LRTRWLDVSGL